MNKSQAKMHDLHKWHYVLQGYLDASQLRDIWKVFEPFFIFVFITMTRVKTHHPHHRTILSDAIDHYAITVLASLI